MDATYLERVEQPPVPGPDEDDCLILKEHLPEFKIQNIKFGKLDATPL